MNIAAAFTDGDADNLRVGRNGIFYDRQGRDWDATIVKIVEHPISIRQAFWAPYKRFARMVAEQIEKFAASKEKDADSKLSTAAATVTPQAAAPAPPAAAPPFDIGKFAGIFAAIGLAVGALGTALASFMTGLMTLRWWQIPLALAGLVLVISGPSTIIAWLKLRQRNLGPILDACGWAVNTRAKLNIPFGKTLTGMPRLPEGAQRTMEDPYAEKTKPWKLWLILAALLAAAVIFWSRGTFAPKPSGEKTQPAITAPAEQPKASAPTPSVSPSTPPSSPAAPSKAP